MPHSNYARLFYRAAIKRYEEATVLLRFQHTTGAIYLAGYAVECMLKALLLESIPPTQADSMLSSFRGAKAHDFTWLRDLYQRRTNRSLTQEMNLHLNLVNDWSTDLRYNPTTIPEHEAKRFMASTQSIIRWANGRF